LKILILVHVLSAIIGVGPTFFGHVLMREKQSIQELRFSLKTWKYLEFFPKIGGTIAFLSGIILIIIGNYGSFLQLWLVGSLILYIIIQIIVVGFIAPRQKKIASWLFAPENSDADSLPADIQKLQSQVNTLFYIASAFGITLFIFMIVKPSVFV
jgi:uncharacterized membrane protein SirB2